MQTRAGARGGKLERADRLCAPSHGSDQVKCNAANDQEGRQASRRSRISAWARLATSCTHRPLPLSVSHPELPASLQTPARLPFCPGCSSKAPTSPLPAEMAPPGRQPPALLRGVAVAGPATLLAAAGASGRVAAAVGSNVLLLSSDGSSTLLPPPPDSAGKPLACLAAAGTFVAAGERGSKAGLYVWRIGACGGAEGEGTEIAHALHNFGIAALAFSPSGKTGTHFWVLCNSDWHAPHVQHTQNRHAPAPTCRCTPSTSSPTPLAATPPT